MMFQNGAWLMFVAAVMVASVFVLATFVGFAPVEDPALIMLVKIDEPKDDPLGGIVAAPVFGKLAPQILSYLNVRPTAQVAQVWGGAPQRARRCRPTFHARIAPIYLVRGAPC